MLGASQPKPGVFLASYLEWVKANYILWSGGLAKRTSSKQLPATPSDPTVSTLATPTKNTCDVCEEFDMSEAHSYVQGKTCLECGNVTRKKMNATQGRSRSEHEPNTDDKKWLKPPECPHTHITDAHSSSEARRTYCRGCNSYWVQRIVSDTASASTGPDPEIEARTERIVSDTASTSTKP